MAEIRIEGEPPVLELLESIKAEITARADNPFRVVMSHLLFEPLDTPAVGFDVSRSRYGEGEAWMGQLTFGIITTSTDPQKARDDNMRHLRWLLILLDRLPPGVLQVRGGSSEGAPVDIDHLRGFEPLEDDPTQISDRASYISQFDLTIAWLDNR